MDAMRRTPRRAVLALVAAMLSGACSDPAGPVDEGRVDAVLTDAPSSSQGVASSGASPAPATASGFQGRMSGSAKVEIYSEARGWVALGSPESASVDLQSAAEARVHGEASAPSGTYTRVRLVLSGGAADIAAGADLGGLVLGAAVRIVLGGDDGEVVVEKGVTPFTVSATTTATVRFDLNSEAWVTRYTAESKAAADAEIQSATTAEVVGG